MIALIQFTLAYALEAASLMQADVRAVQQIRLTEAWVVTPADAAQTDFVPLE